MQRQEKQFDIYSFIGQIAENVYHCPVHLLSISFEESPASSQEKRVPCENHGALAAVLALDEVADVACSVTRREQAFDIQVADFEVISVPDFLGESLDSVVPTEKGEAGMKLSHLFVATCMVPESKT